MKTEFWENIWRQNELGFHDSTPNPLLVAHFSKLNLPEGARMFVPLCGKTLDIHWLLAEGYQVVAVELSKTAIEQLFAELGLSAEITRSGRVSRYSGHNIDVFVGDIFDVSGDTLGPVDAIYDRAALVALPAAMRARYAKHVIGITDAANQLLITFDYDQHQMEGPPFAIGRAEVKRHYQECYQLSLLNGVPVPGGLKGVSPAIENIWLLDNP